MPLVSTCHTWYDDNRLVWLYGVIDRRILRGYNAVVAVSDDVRNRLLSSGVQSDHIHFIRNGIDLRPFTNATPSLHHLATHPEGLLVGWIGRLTRDKGPDLFLRAIAQLRPNFPNTRYLMVGEGPYRSECERLITHLALGDVVHLLGQRFDMPAIYASCDFLVSSSRMEGLPMAILEGMASSRPWVAPAVGAIPLAILDGRNGILIPPGDVETLAGSMARLMRSAEDRVQMGADARRLVEAESSAEHMSEDYLRVYEDVRLQTCKAGGKS
jgi:glycosyltransferase involved in cell wall biosynthesis